MLKIFGTIMLCYGVFFMGMALNGGGTVMGIVFAAIGLWMLSRSHKKTAPRRGSGSSHDYRCTYDTTRYAYDDHGNCYDTMDGSFAEGLDGRFYGSNVCI